MRLVELNCERLRQQQLIAINASVAPHPSSTSIPYSWFVFHIYCKYLSIAFTQVGTSALWRTREMLHNGVCKHNGEQVVLLLLSSRHEPLGGYLLFGRHLKIRSLSSCDDNDSV